MYHITVVMATNRIYLKVTYSSSDDNQQEITESNITNLMTTYKRYLKVTYYCSEDNQHEIIESNILLQ